MSDARQPGKVRDSGDGQPESGGEKKTWRLGLVSGTFVTLAAAYLVVLTGTSLRLWWVHHLLKSHGIPVSAEEVIPPEIPDSLNSAPRYLTAWATVDVPSGYTLEVEEDMRGYSQCTVTGNVVDWLAPWHFNGWTTAKMEACFADLMAGADMDAMVELVREANALPSCRFDCSYSTWPKTNLRDTGKLRRLTRLLCYRARFLAEQGRTQEAWEHLIDAAKAVRAARDQPFVVSQLVRCGQVMSVGDMIDDLCLVAPPRKDEWEQLRGLFTEYDDPRPMEQAHDGERIWHRDTIHAGVFEGARNQLDYVAQVVLFTPCWQLDEAAFLQYSVIVGTRFDTSIWPAKQHNPPAKYYLLANGEIDEYSLITTSWRNYDLFRGRLRLMRIGLALWEHRRLHGEWPPTLADIDLADDEEEARLAELKDPLSGEVFHYIPGEVVYGVGLNGIDDHAELDERGSELDSCFRLVPKPLDSRSNSYGIRLVGDEESWHETPEPQAWDPFSSE